MRKTVEVKISKFQWNNLQKLHDYLVANKKKVTPHFDMAVYLVDTGGNSDDPMGGKSLNKCGSVGCLVGHGPVAGIPAYTKDPHWLDYSTRVFGTKDDWDPLYIWLFDGEWSEHNNTVGHAIKRLAFTLKHKAVPKEHELTED